jgi:hypothetical protein
MANFANLAYGLVRTPPTPSTSGTELTLELGHGDRMPPVPFPATIWPVTVMPDPATAEIVTVTGRIDDTLTIVRAQQGTLARDIIASDQLAGTITKAYLDVVPLTTDPLVTFTGAVTVNGVTTTGPLTAVGGLATTGGLAVTGAASIGGALTVAGTLGVAGLVLTPKLRGYSEPWQLATLVGGTLSIDYALGNHTLVSLSANVTAITITNVPASGEVGCVMLYYVATGGVRAVAHIINGHVVRFANATPPIMSTLSGYIDRVLYTTWDGGLTWLGDIIGLNY